MLLRGLLLPFVMILATPLGAYSQLVTVWTNMFLVASNAEPAGNAFGDYLAGAELDGAENMYLTGSQNTVKYDRDGRLLWHVPIPGGGIQLFPYGGCLITSFWGTTRLSETGAVLWQNTNVTGRGLEVDSQGNVTVMSSAYDEITRISAEGVFQWTQSCCPDPENGCEIYGIKLTPAGDAFVTGGGSVPDGSTFGSRRFFATRIDRFGQRVWSHYIQSDANYTYGHSVALDQSGAGYFLGKSYSQYTLDQSVLVKKDLLGNSSVLVNEVSAVALDSAILSGRGTVQINPQGDLLMLIPARSGVRDSALVKLDPSGSRRFTTLFDGGGVFTFGQDESIYLGNFEFPYVFGADIQALRGKTEVVRLDPDGSQVWRFPIGNTYRRGGLRILRLFVRNSTDLYIAANRSDYWFFNYTRNSYFVGRYKINNAPDLPRIVRPPRSQSARIGSLCTFDVQAIEADPSPSGLTYQWLFEGEPILGSTQPEFSLPETSINSSGWYSVIVSNDWGSVKSTEAFLAVRTELQSTGASTAQMFAFEFPAGSNRLYSIETSGSEFDWLTLTNVTGSGVPLRFEEPIASRAGQRFYRLRSETHDDAPTSP